MTILHRSAIVPYSAAEMYQLVNAIADYPQFLPWCKASHVVDHDEDEIHATLILSGGGFQKSFTTCNRLQKDKMIEIRLLNGPLHHLEGFWTFDSLAEHHSKVTLDLEFEFASKLMSFAIAPVFHHATNTLVDAFCQRAIEVYGTR